MRGKGIFAKNGQKLVSPFAITSVAHFVTDFTPLWLLPTYWQLMREVRRRNVTVFGKSATPEKHDGNVFLWKTWTILQYIKAFHAVNEDGRRDWGMVNAYGLTNRGLAAAAEYIVRAWKQGYDIIPNVYPWLDKPVDETMRQLEAPLLYLFREGRNPTNALEVSISCPNSGIDNRLHSSPALEIVRRLKRDFPWVFLIVKVRPDSEIQFIKDLISAGADAIHHSNTFVYADLFPGQRSPLKNGLGGGSGPFTWTERAVDTKCRVREAIPDTQFIVGCGVADIRKARQAFTVVGADAVTACSAFSPCSALATGLRSHREGMAMLRELCPIPA